MGRRTQASRCRHGLLFFVALSIRSALSRKERLHCPAINTSDCCWTTAELDEANRQVVHGLLKRIVATPFFAHFKVNLCSSCGLWQDNPMCSLRDCSVCECEEPPAWASADDCGGEQLSKLLDLEVHPSIATGWPAPAFDQAVADSASDESAGDAVVDLRLNPERYTGYSGESAARVWRAVHEENAFLVENGTLPTELRVYNRLLSGLHASVSLHIARTFCLQRDAMSAGECALWGPAPSLAAERVLQHADRLENLYTAFAVLLRAVVKAGPAISAAVPKEDPDFVEGLEEWESQILPEVRQLATACPKTFAEEALFAGPTGGVLWEEVEKRLQHLTEVMKCVGCDRCKLWGTLQTLGINTALRVLFKAEDQEDVQLSRQEAVALVHTLERFSSSLEFASFFLQQMPSCPHADGDCTSTSNTNTV